MKRSGFTMIELIFVIVILGILASVAIPKLAATRDDAKVSKALSEVSTVVSELGAFYTSRGQFDALASNMTNVSDINYTTAWNATTGTGVLTYNTPDNTGVKVPCVTFTISNADGNMTVAPATTISGNICTGITTASSFTSDLQGTKLFGGSRVSF